MTAQEKAHDIYNSLYQRVADGGYPEDNAKELSFILIDEVLSALSSDRIDYSSIYRSEEHYYWEEVKKEIEAL